MRWPADGRLLLAGLVILATASCAPEQDSIPRTAERSAVRDSGHSGEVIFDSCRLCHSTQEMQRGPILDGLPAWYVEGQLAKFYEKRRGSNPENRAAALMASAMEPWSHPAEWRRVADHIAQIPPRKHLVTVRGDVRAGAQVYENCVVCHGDRAQGMPAVKGPPLNVQEDWYLLDQMRKFKSGLRGNHAQDVEGQVMRAAVQHLEDEQMRDVVAYLARGPFATNQGTEDEP